ncbi:MAG: hypothetical protein K2X01_02565 [Cyanobacteria bacterium]|nr:hypothetical protein [Cyanobacteriota bacterium]
MAIFGAGLQLASQGLNQVSQLLGGGQQQEECQGKKPGGGGKQAYMKGFHDGVQTAQQLSGGGQQGQQPPQIGGANNGGMQINGAFSGNGINGIFQISQGPQNAGGQLLG